MKKLLLAFVFVAGISAVAAAQTESKAPVSKLEANSPAYKKANTTAATADQPTLSTNTVAKQKVAATPAKKKTVAARKPKTN